MKKVLFVAAIAAFAFGATSCKKDYTCHCTGEVDGIEIDDSTDLGKLSKKDAEDKCVSETEGITCELK